MPPATCTQDDLPDESEREHGAEPRPARPEGAIMGRYDRQLIEFTEEEQGRIRSANVGIVGCGGLGPTSPPLSPSPGSGS